MHRKNIWKYILVVVCIYGIYIISGVLLVQNNVVKKWRVTFNSVYTSEGGSHHGTAPAGTDGPHVFYSDSNIIVKSVVQSDTGLTGTIDTFRSKSSITINCRFSEHPDWNFTTTLKDSLSIETSAYPEADSLIAISDIEGEFGAFRELLIANRVMNNTYEWTFGTGHLVLLGDFFDRGIHVTETLWLIYHLEQQAEQLGGKVHFILGNHELMNMQDDIRYVSNKYIENTYLIKANYKTWFKPGTELGNWLTTKNVIEQVGRIIFTHAGIAEEINNLSRSIQNINEKCRPYYFTNKEQRNTIADAETKLLFASASAPFWYRGYAKGEATQKQVNTTLMLYNAETIVIGHTTVEDVTTYYNNRIINIDTKHALGNSQGLFYSNGKYYRINKSGNRTKL